MNNLLYNLTPENRELVDHRLKQFKRRRKQLLIRCDELEAVENDPDHLRILTSEVLTFCSDPREVFTQGPPQEKLTTIRQCI